MAERSKSSDGIDNLFYGYRNCTACGLHQNRKRLIRGTGDPNADVVFLFDRVSHRASLSGNVLEGQEGGVLLNLINHLGHDKHSFWYSYVVLCPPKASESWSGPGMLALPKISELHACRARVHMEVHLVQPEVIVACGANALKSLHEKTAPTFSSNVGRVLESFIGGDLVSYPIPTMVTHSMTHLIRNQKSAIIWNKSLDHIGEAIAIAKTLATTRKENTDVG